MENDAQIISKTPYVNTTAPETNISLRSSPPILSLCAFSILSWEICMYSFWSFFTLLTRSIPPCLPVVPQPVCMWTRLNTEIMNSVFFSNLWTSLIISPEILRGHWCNFPKYTLKSCKIPETLGCSNILIPHLSSLFSMYCFSKDLPLKNLSNPGLHCGNIFVLFTCKYFLFRAMQSEIRE